MLRSAPVRKIVANCPSPCTVVSLKKERFNVNDNTCAKNVLIPIEHPLPQCKKILQFYYTKKPLDKKYSKLENEK